MTAQRRHLTTEDFAAREPHDHERTDEVVDGQDTIDRDATGQDTAGQDAAGRTGTNWDATGQDEAGRNETGWDATGRDMARQDVAGQDVAGQDAAGYGRTDGEQTRDGVAPHESVDHDRTDHDKPGHNKTLGDADGYQRTDGDSGFEPRERESFDRDPVEEPAAGSERSGEFGEPVEVSTTAGDTPLFTTDEAADYQAEWRALQADFVDEPREAVRRADELVAQVMQTLATTFAQHKNGLEEQWREGEEAQTEELRQALKRYRAFFDRLLSV
ncbi:MAG: hypothetical protein HOV94_38920 [Saccharothrix sp.]|nr:hypothetical protein [Saccharothrix sp.]